MTFSCLHDVPTFSCKVTPLWARAGAAVPVIENDSPTNGDSGLAAIVTATFLRTVTVTLGEVAARRVDVAGEVAR